MVSVHRSFSSSLFFSFFFNDTATTEIYTLSLHDALPIFHWRSSGATRELQGPRSIRSQTVFASSGESIGFRDRKSTRLNSSHANISYAVFCLKKKNKKNKHTTI